MKLPKAYAGVTFSVSLISFNYIFHVDLERQLREKVLSPQFTQLMLGNEHKVKIGDDLAHFGMPDDGNGRYTEFRAFSDWYFLNIEKRIHRNDFEHIVTVLPLSLINGLIYPRVTTGILLTYIVGRALYSAGYREKEGAFNQFRIAGSLMVNVAHLATIGLSGFIGIRLARGSLCL